MFAPSPEGTPRNDVASATSPPITLPPSIQRGQKGTVNDNVALRSGKNIQQKAVTLGQIRSVFIDLQAEEFKILLRNSLLVRLTKAGFVTNVDENEADARLSIRETKTGRLSVSLISGKARIWGDHLTVEMRTSEDAEKLADELTTRLEQARKTRRP